MAGEETNGSNGRLDPLESARYDSDPQARDARATESPGDVENHRPTHTGSATVPARVRGRDSAKLHRRETQATGGQTHADLVRGDPWRPVIDPGQGLDSSVDLTIDNGAIAAVGLDLHGRLVLDPTGCVVAPGFIDLHSHAQSVAGHRLQAFDGVTTTLELEAGAIPVAAAYSRAQAEGRPLNYGPRARARSRWARTPTSSSSRRTRSATRRPMRHRPDPRGVSGICWSAVSRSSRTGRCCSMPVRADRCGGPEASVLILEDLKRACSPWGCETRVATLEV